MSMWPTMPSLGVITVNLSIELGLDTWKDSVTHPAVFPFAMIEAAAIRWCQRETTASSGLPFKETRH